MDVSVKTNIAEFTKHLDWIQKQQVPYAASRAINEVAVQAQEAIQSHIQSAFKNRKKWWGKNQPTGIKVEFSKKDYLHARVYTNAYFAKIQEEGGIKHPKSGRNLAIPTERVPRRYRVSSGGRQMLNERPDKVFRNSKGIYQKRGKNRIEPLFTFSQSANVKPRLHFADIASKVVNRRFNAIFKKWLEQALATAK